MTLEEEKRFVLLASVLDLGGHAQKHDVLDNVAAKGYMKLNADDLAEMQNRAELRWRNDLAFIRKHLVTGRYLDGSRFDNWEITRKGREYFESLCATVLSQRFFQKLSAAAVSRAAE
jgi:hypothetical protein